MIRRPRAFPRALVALPLAAAALAAMAPRDDRAPAPACAPENGGLTLPEGFCAVVVGTQLGAVRQLAVAPNGDLYAAVGGRTAEGSAGVLAFRDTTGDGVPDLRVAFGPGGMNDVKIAGGFLYGALPDRVVRWRLDGRSLAPVGEPETVVKDLPADGGHAAKSIAIGRGDTLFVNVGSKSNSCQVADRQARSPGADPCVELERRAGIWHFSATATDQVFDASRRYATGLRNAMALAVHPQSRVLHAAVMGRDQLAQNWGFPEPYSAENPAEEFFRVERGADMGWPYCYWSNETGAKVLAPEYGGDGTKTERCAATVAPLVAFPGHWAPLALAFWRGDAFGTAYREGAFLAFHGSWNRAPLPQAGYRVVFVPMKGGKPAGAYRTFATLTGQETGLRASGVAVGTDGSLYISGDRNGTIWKVVRRPRA